MYVYKMKTTLCDLERFSSRLLFIPDNPYFIFFSLGNLKSLTKDGGLHQFLLDNHKKFGPIFSFYWGKELTVSLASQSLWKCVVSLFDRPGVVFLTLHYAWKPLLKHYLKRTNFLL